jgi:hypothetical protein
MIWLVNGQVAPAGLVLKERLGRLCVVDGQWEVRRMLPERLPVCTWAEIRKYLENGCDLEHPAPGETMSDYERELISDMLTDRQMELMILTAKQSIQDEKKENKVPQSVQNSVSEAKSVAESLMAEGATKDEVRDVLADDYPIPVVMRVLNQIGG